MHIALAGLFMLLAGAGELLAASPAITNSTPAKAPAAVPSAEDPVEKEYKALLEADDTAQEEVDKWIRDNEEFSAKGGGLAPEQLNRKIRDRFASVRKGYEDFLQKHPDHVRARVAYGSFLGDIHDEDGAQEQLEKALPMATNNPAVYNNLANIYGHTGPVKKAFEFYTRAIELNPREPVYYHNFGTTVYLFRADAKEFFGITEQQVFDKALTLYSNAMRLDPANFPLASDIAQTYYGIKPPRTEDALIAWTNALKIARDEIEREGVHIHFARIKLNLGRFDEARRHLSVVTNQMYADLKKRLAGNLQEMEAGAAKTNAVPSTAPPKPSPPPSAGTPAPT